eukprot:gnl/Chilomastix_caulleri/2639.p1 GENE.gnl/Chilomastix_caulleri/2639~~gnl/Chilomastix_caulleri/2639.p1  ORF type:complete len:155 (+),score=35.05 gnl/Chilomastix_caulleri/2639:77-541(+)
MKLISLLIWMRFRTRTTEEMKCDYFLEAKHPEYPGIQEFVAATSTVPNEFIDDQGCLKPCHTPPSTQITFYIDNSGVLMRTRTLTVTGPKLGTTRNISYERSRVSPGVNNLETMDAGQIMSVQRVIVVDGDDGDDLIITTTLDGGITIWKKMGN